MADIQLDPNPQSTWGASVAYKKAWQEKYGSKAAEKTETDQQAEVSPATPTADEIVAAADEIVAAADESVAASVSSDPVIRYSK